MNPSSILINRARFILMGGLMAGMAGMTGMAHTQSPGGGQVGGIGTGGAPAGQLPSDIRNTSIDPRYRVDPRNTPINQRNPYERNPYGGATAGQAPLDPRNIPLGQRDMQGGATTAAQSPYNSRNIPIGQRDTYSGATVRQHSFDPIDASARQGNTGQGNTGQGNPYGSPAIGQSQFDLRNVLSGPNRTYGGAATAQFPVGSRSAPTGLTGPTGPSSPYGFGTTAVQAPSTLENIGQKHIYGATAGQTPFGSGSAYKDERQSYDATMGQPVPDQGKASVGKKRAYSVTAPQQPPTGSGKTSPGEKDTQDGRAQPSASVPGNASPRERQPQGSVDSGRGMHDRKDPVGEASRRQESISIGRERAINPGPLPKVPETGGR